MPGGSRCRAGRFCPGSVTILLTLLVTPVFLLTPTPPATPAPAPTPEPLPRVQVQFDPQRRVLWWACQEDAEYEHLTCEMEQPGKDSAIQKPRVLSPWVASSPPQAGTCGCTFQLLPLWQGAAFDVSGALRGTPVHQRLLHGNPGVQGSAAQNFSCLIYAAEFMNCTWAKGPAAPDDVQYFLYLRDTKMRRDQPCQSYLQESGRHVGCHLPSVSNLTSFTYFLVNGSSSRTQIRFFDTVLSLKKIEVYDPPRNISVSCSAAHCLVRWLKPRTLRPKGDLEFQYQLQLQRLSQPSRPTQIPVPGAEENQYKLPKPRGRQSLQMRSANARLNPGDPWGTWSRPLPFGYEEPTSSLAYVYVLVVLGTLACASLLLFMCRRFLGNSMLFSRIPQVRDKLNDGQQLDQQVPWEKCLATEGKTDSEHILVVTLQENTQTQPCPGSHKKAGCS